MQKGRKIFNVIIIITIIALLGAGGYAAYYYINRYSALKEAETAAEEFEKSIIVVAMQDEEPEQEQEPQPEPQPEQPTQTTTTQPRRTTSTTTRTTYRGYSVMGTIEIPKTKVKSVVVDKVTPNSISAAVGILYCPNMESPTLNLVGNTVLAAHNYRNGTFFSNNKNLEVGDKIYITDQTGLKVEYIVYKTYTTGETDFDYAVRNTNGKREISLSTCVPDPTKRLVIWAKES